MQSRQQPRLILSPCGTSLLTNGSTDEERRLLNRHANARKPDEMGEDRARVEERIAAVRDRMEKADRNEARRASAELNGILSLYDEEPACKRDHHILLGTDTWLGEQTGQIVEAWLRRNFQISVELHRQSDLQTANLQLFQSALSDLVQWLDSTINAYQQQHYRILFNLTGGFKSVQGFLQTLGNIYADETLYVFESPNSPLLRIPRLPVRFDIIDTVRQHLRVIRRLAHELRVSDKDLSEVPDTFLLRLDGAVTLSPWGSVVWEQSRKQLYSERVWPSPSERIQFGGAFLSSTKDLPSDRLVNLNDRLDKLAQYLEGSQKRPLQSLDLKPLKVKPDPSSTSTHEFDAWADRDAKRVYCHYEGQKLILDRLDKPLH